MRDKFIENILNLVSLDEISEQNAFSLIKQYKTEKKAIMLSQDEDKSSKDIAIIGVACRFPQADKKEEYWYNLVNGLDGVREFPANRLKRIRPFLKDSEDVDSFISAGYLDDVETFDAEFFNILPGEAKYMDPQQRIFMETGYEAIEDAGYGGERIKNSNVGIYTGFSEARYLELINSKAPAVFVGNFPPVIASRLSYALNLSGPALSVATACSSSFVALHLACKGLLAGDCKMALVGGVAIGALPGKLEPGNLGITSEEGRSRSFDADANGTGWGEGCGVILIKKLDQAVKDKDHIYCVIKGSAINQDGTSNGIASPNARAQEEVIVEAWKNAGVDPSSITYIEAHGTGTKIGDPIEVKGITNAFRRYTQNKQFCGVGSVKSNIGHLDSASGMAGLIKVILALKNKKIPPTLHFENPNPLMNLVNSPLYMNTQLREWERSGETPLRAGMNSFGLSGTNCHIVLEEYNNEVRVESNNSQRRIFTLSARNENSLYKLVEKYIEFLQQNKTYNLEEICYVVNTGRDHFQHRLAILVSTKEELIEQLKRFYEERNLQNGRIEKNESIFSSGYKEKLGNSNFNVRVESSAENLIKLACSYVNGENVIWSKYYPSQGCNKLPLPTYAWEEKRYWVNPPESVIDKSLIGNAPENGHLIKDMEKGDMLTNIENKLAYIWEDVLGIQNIDINVNFFEIGGDSLLATSVINAIERDFQVRIPLGVFFENPCINDLSSLILTANAKEQFTVLPAPFKEFYPVSNSQRRQYILQNLSEDNLSYNMPGAAIITGKLDIERFKEAFDKLILRHESFRTIFDVAGEEIIQTILPHVDFNIEYGIIKVENLEEAIVKFIRPFNLDEAPLLRVELQKLIDENCSEEKHFFMFDMHHIISDGVSMEILINEFIQLYEGESLAPLSLQYKDYATWQHDFIKSENMQRQEEFWTKALSKTRSTKFPVLNMPSDYPRPPVMTFEGGTYSFKIPKDVTMQLKSIGREQGATLYMMLLAAYNVLLHHYTDQDDIIVGSLVAGRKQAGLEETIGPFTNYLPIRNYPKGELKFVDFLKNVVNQTLAVFDNQDYPFEKIVEKFDSNRDISRNPIFDTMLILHNQGLQNKRIDMNELVLEMIDWQSKTSTIDIKVDIFEETNGDLNCRFEYYTGLFKEETIAEMARHFATLIEQIVNEPFLKLKDYCVFTAEEKKRSGQKRRDKIPQFYPAPQSTSYPLSYYQSHVFKKQKDINNYIISAELTGKIIPSSFAKALEISQLEDSRFRTTFSNGEIEPSQVIHEILPIDFKYWNDSNIDIDSLLASEHRHQFDTFEGPLYRIRLVNLGGDKYHLVVTLHPLITEYLDMNKFLSRIFNHYKLGDLHKSPDYAKDYPALSMADISHWQRQLLEGGYLDSQKKYWLKILNKQNSCLGLPVKTKEKNYFSLSKGHKYFSLENHHISCLESIAKHNDTSLIEVLLGCYALVLKQSTQMDDVLINLMYSDVSKIKVNDISFGINQPVPIQISMEGITSFNHLMDSIKTMCSEGADNILFPAYSLFYREYHDGKENKGFNVFFSVENWDTGLNSISLTKLHFDFPEPSLLKLSIVNNRDGISCAFSWNSDLLETEYICSLVERYQKILTTLVKSVSK
ncbi:condensation domain-containing protein [Bacillus cereus]|uniref:condensation domain-containing protein n=1 Tax=Bacillus cereus TaxID=1396 RepID=UPI00124713C6|nr:condensation domain-containing protein [Bacillus cereus]MCU5475460.1 condensation domain-containing protein [Bacillus cereus]MCU5614895.1 condensation domain-containing protein [Bacillus cereus]